MKIKFSNFLIIIFYYFFIFYKGLQNSNIYTQNNIEKNIPYFKAKYLIQK
jgi:hypothetical protein